MPLTNNFTGGVQKLIRRFRADMYGRPGLEQVLRESLAKYQKGKRKAVYYALEQAVAAQ